MMELLDKTTTQRYLLGNLSEAERAAFEQDWFGDKAKYYELCEVENNLIDEYVRGQLNESDRELFEQNFLTIPARRERVATAKALLREVDPPVLTNSSPALWERLAHSLNQFRLLPALAISAAILLVVVGVWFVRKSDNRQHQIAKIATPTPPIQSSSPEPTETFAPKLNASSPNPVPSLAKSVSTRKHEGVWEVVPLTILLREEGSNSVPVVNLANTFTKINLKLPLPANDYRGFTATLRSVDGEEIKHWKSIKVKNHAEAFLELPAILTKVDDYILIINGIKMNGESEEFRRYSFQVRKKN